MAAARRSIELDPTSAGATQRWRVRRCCSKTTARWRSMGSSERWSSIRATCRAAAGTRSSTAWACGDFERGIAEARRALDSDPLSCYVTMTLAHSVCSRPAGWTKRSRRVRRATQLDPGSFVCALDARHRTGTRRTIRRGGLHARDSRRDVVAPPARLAGLAAVFGQWGKLSAARAVHRELLDRGSRTYVSRAHLAFTADAAGDHEDAMVFARRAWIRASRSFILWARHFPPDCALHRIRGLRRSCAKWIHPKRTREGGRENTSRRHHVDARRP